MSAMLMYGSQLVAHAETFEELGENDKALNEKLVAHAKELEELKEKNKALNELLVEKDKALNEKIEEMMQNITNDLDKRIAGVSKASIKRDNEIKLAIAAPTGAAKEEEWIEQL